MTDGGALLTERRETAQRHAYALVTVNRPKALNALNRDLVEALAAAFEGLGADPELDGIVLTGAGGRAFVAGADISELRDLTPEAAFQFARRGQEVMRLIEGTGKPVVAAIGGYALGGGLELALACHLRVAGPKARLGLPEVKLGVIPGYGGTQRLPRLIGRGRALRMILTGDPVGSEEALAAGLVDAVHEDAVEGAAALLDRVLANGPLAVRNALLAVDAGLSGLEDGLLSEASLFASVCGRPIGTAPSAGTETLSDAADGPQAVAAGVRLRSSLMVGAPPAPHTVMPGLVPLLSGLIPAGRANGLRTGEFPTDRPARDANSAAPASPPSPPSPPSCPDLFRASTSCGIAV